MSLFRQMKLKKVAFPEQLVSPKRKVFSGFSLVAGASVIVLTITFLNNSLTALGPNYSSIVTWPFIISPHVVPSSSPANAIGDLLDKGGEKKHGQNVSDIIKEGDSLIPNRDGVASEKLPSVGDVHGEVKNGSFDVEEAMVQIQNQTHDPVIAKNGNFTISNGQGIDLEKRNGSVSGEDGRVIGKTGDVSQDRENVNAKEAREEKNIVGDGNKKFIANSTDGKVMVSENNNLANDSCSGKNIRSADEEKRDSGINHTGNSSGENKSDPQLKKMPNPLVGCDFFNGRWVKDSSKPYYPGSSCPFVDPGFDCHRFGRPDEEYLKWKWQPYGCDIPSLNATGFLERLRGKRLVFVGDSLNRNMWESLVCILRHSIRDKERVYEVSGRREFKRKGFYAFRFEDYNCTVESAVAPFLVRGLSFNRSFGSYESIRLDLMDERAPKFQDADILIFNTGAWWTDYKTANGVNYYREGNYVYPKLKALDAYKKGLRTWAKWVDQNIDGRRTQVFFKGLSLEHYRGGRWNSGGQCHKEVEPIFNEGYLQKYPPKMRILEGVLHKMKTPVIFLNLSRMTDFRKDGHPSIYRMEYKSDKERIAAEKLQDCNHWCLPGVPDNWNELLYASLLKQGRGSWTS